MTSASGPFAWPIDPRLISRVGESLATKRRGSGRPHKGIDIFAREGTPVRSASAGIVRRVVDGTRAGASEGLRRAGWFVDVVDSEGRIFRYLHLSADPVARVGELVSPRTVIGTVGTSGVEHAGPHVHFEIRSYDWSSESRQYGPPVDPLSLLAPRETSPMANVDSADQRIAIGYLVAQGWTEAAARELLTRKREDPAQVAANQLGLLGWNKDEIARFIAGPEKAAKTAESLYRAVAGATADTRTAFASVLRQGGAGDVTIPDVKVSARKVTAKAKPTDLGDLLAGFADLPPNEQKRFLSLLTKEPPGGRESSSGKLPNPDVLYGPLIKGGVEAVTTALKKLLGTDSGGKTAVDGQGKKPSKGSGDKTSMEDKGKQPEPTGPSDTDDKEPSDTDTKEPSDTDTKEPSDTDDKEPSDTDKAEITTEDDRSDLPDTDTDIGVIDAPDDDIDLPDQSKGDDSGAQPNDSSDSSPVDASEPD